MNGKLQEYLDEREPWRLNLTCCDGMNDLVAGRGDLGRCVKENPDLQWDLIGLKWRSWRGVE